MVAEGVLGTILAVLLVVLVGTCIVAVVLAIRSLREAREFMSETRERLLPLLEKADVTVDAINAELLRLDGIVTQVEDVSGTVSTATEFIRSPVNKVAEAGARLIGAIRSSRRR